MSELPVAVLFAHPDAGYDGDQRLAARHLVPGRVYLLHTYQVEASHSWVELLDVPGVHFNAVMFHGADQADVWEPEPEMSREEMRTALARLDMDQAVQAVEQATWPPEESP